jgi:hypothetical protein
MTTIREALADYLNEYEGVYDSVSPAGFRFQSESAKRAEANARAALAAQPAASVALPDPDFWLDGGTTPCFYESSIRAALAAPVVAQPALPDGFTAIAVKNFEALVDSLALADRDGYMPAAVFDAWAAFRCLPLAAQPAQAPVAWWRTSYEDEHGNKDADVQIGEACPSRHMPDNGFAWEPLYSAPVAAQPAADDTSYRPVPAKRVATYVRAQPAQEAERGVLLSDWLLLANAAMKALYPERYGKDITILAGREIVRLALKNAHDAAMGKT